MGRIRIALAAACALGAFPATAGATCANFNKLLKVKSYGGTASTSYVSGTLVGPPPPGLGADSATLSIDRSAANLKIADLRSRAIEGATFGSSSQPTGGSVSVNDSYHDPTTNTHQTASGPTTAGGDGNGVQILANGTKCTYQVLVSYRISTVTTGDEADPGVADNATSPNLPIPSNLVLKGSATIPASGGGGSPGNSGLYDLSGDPVYGLWIDYVTGGHPKGTARISWDLNPAGGGSKAGCVVPRVVGRTEKAAAKAIRKAGCRVGQVTRAHSHKVAKGKVISSHPKAGRKEPSGTKVGLVVSSGR